MVCTLKNNSSHTIQRPNYKISLYCEVQIVGAYKKDPIAQ